jgi:hypothetical protein
MPENNDNTIVRVTVKLPQYVADYFRSAFRHGERSQFIQKCILEHKHKKNIESIEKGLRQIKDKS